MRLMGHMGRHVGALGELSVVGTSLVFTDLMRANRPLGVCSSSLHQPDALVPRVNSYSGRPQTADPSSQRGYCGVSEVWCCA
jgi:hypothetical protein